MERFDKEFLKKNEEEDLPENRSKRLTGVSEFLKRIDVENIVEDPEKKKHFIENTSFEDFKKILLRINGIFRDTPISEREYFDIDKPGSAIITVTEEKSVYVPPLEGKLELLEDAWEATKRLYKKNREDAAFMLGASIGSIHPFENANGRVARLVAILIASDKEKTIGVNPSAEDLKEFIEQHQNLKYPQLEPINIKSVDSINPEHLNNLTSVERKIFLTAIIYDTDNFSDTVRLFCLKNNIDFENRFFDRNIGKLKIQEFLREHSDQIKDILGLYNNKKKEYIRILIDLFENPQKYKISDLYQIYNQLDKETKEIFKNKTFLDLYHDLIKNQMVVEKGFSWDTFIKEVS